MDDFNGVFQEKEVPEYKQLISIHAEKKTRLPLKDTLRFDGDSQHAGLWKKPVVASWIFRANGGCIDVKKPEFLLRGANG